MGRLIDADALYERLQKDSSYDLDFFDAELREIIETQPTAYDVEKVVDSVRADCYTMGFDESQTEILVDDVRKGGVE